MVKQGLINLDFADVETVMSRMGKAMMGTGEAEGEDRATKATEMALNNPLIDDYSLRGARGLLINITGGEDLTLFETDEIVNKIRQEVDHAAEIIIGSVTDNSLEGKVRVSIVATALDGQQPESKSVINMVHRIQNRNPGYSDFSTMNNSQAFNFSNTSTITSGANALKVEEEINKSEQTNIENQQSLEESIYLNDSPNQPNVNDGEESLVLTEEVNDQDNVSNGLENFGLSEEEPNLFDSSIINNENDINHDELSSDNQEEDDYEIPAFLRRQKN